MAGRIYVPGSVSITIGGVTVSEPPPPVCLDGLRKLTGYCGRLREPMAIAVLSGQWSGVTCQACLVACFEVCLIRMWWDRPNRRSLRVGMHPRGAFGDLSGPDEQAMYLPKVRGEWLRRVIADVTDELIASALIRRESLLGGELPERCGRCRVPDPWLEPAGKLMSEFPEWHGRGMSGPKLCESCYTEQRQALIDARARMGPPPPTCELCQ